MAVFVGPPKGVLLILDCRGIRRDPTGLFSHWGRSCCWHVFALNVTHTNRTKLTLTLSPQAPPPPQDSRRRYSVRAPGCMVTREWDRHGPSMSREASDVRPCLFDVPATWVQDSFFCCCSRKVQGPLFVVGSCRLVVNHRYCRRW